MLRRLSYPVRFADLSVVFNRPKPELCELFNLGLEFIHSRFADRLTNMNQPWLAVPRLLEYCQAFQAKGSQLPYCWGAIDGTVRSMCRPSRHQREVFNGHKRVHALKFQSIVTPNGLIAHLYGPMPGRRHDAALLNASGVLTYMQQHMQVNGQPLCVYGDSAYPISAQVQRPFRGHLTQQQQQFNTAMSGVRQCVEWGFKDVITNWAFLDFEKNLKLFLSPVGKLYVVAVLLTNCHTCLYGNQTSDFFGLKPPTLDEYLY